jgi:predicted flap endonuclease-1-like 5' DNA nuclease
MTNLKIEDVEGIGPDIGGKLRACGIEDSDRLLAETKTPKQRQALAAKSGISEKLVLKYANMVDLYRISGVGKEYAELLEASGVDTVPELAQRNPADLHKKLEAVDKAKKLTGRIPTEVEVTRWVAQAKTLPRALEY